MIWQFLINGIITGMIYGLVALGFALVYNTTRIFHVAYAAIYMVAGYFLLFFLRTAGLPLILSILLSIAGTILVGLLTEFLVYSPLSRRNSSSNVIMVSSIGAMIIIINAVSMLFGNEAKIINPGISGTLVFGSIMVTYTQIFQFISAVILFVLFFLFLKHSNFGIKTRAYRDDPVLSEVLGTNTIKLKRTLFVLSSFFAATASCLIAYDVGMNPYVGMPVLLNAVVALIIGGVGRFEAPLLGGLIIGILQSMVVYFTSARWQDAVTFSLLLIFLLLRPQGILGDKTRNV